MKEINQINNNINGEKPATKYDILRVTNINNPNEILENFKKAIIVILNNKKLKPTDKHWEQLMPKSIVTIANELTEEDYKNDELVFSLPTIIEAVQNTNLKEWEWYSSRLIAPNGFEVIFKGTFRARFTFFVRFQGVELSKISIERDSKVYQLKVFKDIMTYKKCKEKKDILL